MSVSKLPSGRYRAQVHHDGKVLSAGKVLGLRVQSFATEREALDAVTHARDKLAAHVGNSDVTVRGWWERWTTDSRFQRAKRSTDIVYRRGTQAFVDRYGALPMIEVDDLIVDQWLQDGSKVWTAGPLRVMFGDAMRKPLRLIASNPFSNLGLRRTEGRANLDPPTEEQAWAMIRAAAFPGFAAWLQVAMFTGMRPAELDALQWNCVDLQANRIEVRRQYSRQSREFTLPKNGRTRRVPILPQTREGLELAASMSKRGEFVFVNTRGDHWIESARLLHWRKVRKATGWRHDLYLATRHFAGHYLYETCRVPAEDVAVMLGHRDGGALVRSLYGHHSAENALGRIVDAVAVQSARPLRSVA